MQVAMVEREMMRQEGFSLVELAIVLVIVGLLIGGELAAQSMITTARNTRIINDISKYQIAIRLFENQYNYLPGNTVCNTGDGKKSLV